MPVDSEPHVGEALVGARPLGEALEAPAVVVADEADGAAGEGAI